MPAMNTMRFDGVKNRMPNDTQPVPPIFEPEIAAEVVVAAGFAKRPRREYWVGSPTVEAIVAQRIFPGLSQGGAIFSSDNRVMTEPRSLLLRGLTALACLGSSSLLLHGPRCYSPADASSEKSCSAAPVEREKLALMFGWRRSRMRTVAR